MIRFGVRFAAVQLLLLSLLVMAGCIHEPLPPPAGVRTNEVDEVETSFQSGGEEIRVDVYRPTSAGRHAAAIILHGSGGIHAIAPATTNRYARRLAQLGIEALVVHYFDGTGHFRADDQAERDYYYHWVREVKDAVTWAQQRTGVRPDRISLVGQSLGAWVAVGAAVSDPRIYRMALFGAGLEPFLEDSLKHVPPTLLFHGDADDVVPLSDAQHLAAQLRANGRRVLLMVYPTEQHELSDSAATDALLRTARFLAPTRPRAHAPTRRIAPHRAASRRIARGFPAPVGADLHRLLTNRGNVGARCVDRAPLTYASSIPDEHGRTRLLASARLDPVPLSPTPP